MSEHPQMTAYLAEARWFAGKGREYDVVDVTRVGTLPGPPTVTIDIITVEYAPEGGAEAGAAAGGEPTTERYQMPLSHYTEEQGRIGHAYIGPHYDEDLGDVHSYDAVHDREAMAVYLDTFARTPPEQPRAVRRRHLPPGRRLRPRHRGRTRPCSAASRATPRSPSATTA